MAAEAQFEANDLEDPQPRRSSSLSGDSPLESIIRRSEEPHRADTEENIIEEESVSRERVNQTQPLRMGKETDPGELHKFDAQPPHSIISVNSVVVDARPPGDLNHSKREESEAFVENLEPWRRELNERTGWSDAQIAALCSQNYNNPSADLYIKMFEKDDEGMRQHEFKGKTEDLESSN